MRAHAVCAPYAIAITAELYCWASSKTYFVSANAEFPDDVRREQRAIAYYPWTPFFLLIAAFLFYAPCAVWRVLHARSGVQLAELARFASDASNIQPQARAANLNGMSAHLSSVFLHRYRLGAAGHPDRRRRHMLVRLLNLRYYEAYLTVLYLAVKCAYLLNVFVQVQNGQRASDRARLSFIVTLQLYLMTTFLQTDTQTIYGWSVLLDVLRGVRKWLERLQRNGSVASHVSQLT